MALLSFHATEAGASLGWYLRQKIHHKHFHLAKMKLLQPLAKWPTGSVGPVMPMFEQNDLKLNLLNTVFQCRSLSKYPYILPPYLYNTSFLIYSSMVPGLVFSSSVRYSVSGIPTHDLPNEHRQGNGM